MHQASLYVLCTEKRKDYKDKIDRIEIEKRSARGGSRTWIVVLLRIVENNGNSCNTPCNFTHLHPPTTPPFMQFSVIFYESFRSVETKNILPFAKTLTSHTSRVRQFQKLYRQRCIFKVLFIYCLFIFFLNVIFKMKFYHQN